MPERLASALEQSDALIVLCSPAGASSRWVNDEVRVFVDAGRVEDIFPVIAPDAIEDDATGASFLPEGLRDLQLVAADLRRIKTPAGRVVGDGKSLALMKLRAGLLGIALDDLLERESARRRQRVAVGALATIGGIAALVVAGAIVTATTWRPALNARGHLELRQGPKALSAYNAIGFPPRVEIPLAVEDLDSLNGGLDRISEEEDTYSWTARDSRGLRAWGGRIAEFLQPEVRLRWEVSRTERKDLFRQSRFGVTAPVGAPAALREAEVVLLRGDAPPELVVWKADWRFLSTPISCGDPVANLMDRELAEFYLGEDATTIVWRLRGMTAAARLTSEVAGHHVVRVAELFGAMHNAWREDYAKIVGAPGEPITGARIARRFGERPSRQEARALEELATAIAERSALER